MALTDNVTGWSGGGEAIKLWRNPRFTGADYRSALARQLVGQQLARLGMTDEWLRQGTAVYLVSKIDPQSEQSVAGSLHNLWLGVTNRRIGGVGEIPTILAEGDESAPKLALTQAWDSIRYLAQTYGEEALLSLLRAQGSDQSLGDALQNAIGQSLAEFDAAWVEALRTAHAQPAWIEMANGFDAAAANEHLLALTAPEMAGRQAGSPGAALAADYIAAQFATYGLEPVVELPPIVDSVAITRTASLTETAVLTPTTFTSPELSYFQTFTLEFAALTAVPQLAIDDQEFDYRRDFLTLLNEIPGGGTAAGELVWVEDGRYNGMDLSGKIVIREPGPETANVLGFLPGSDPELRDEVIILGAHYDHVGDDPGGLAYSGANDNASGVAVLLEIARQWQEAGYQPARSILFAAWGAQEAGQIGAGSYLAQPVLPITNTVGVVVLDAVGGGSGHRLMAQGMWEREGLLLFGMEQVELDALAATGHMTMLAIMSIAR